MSSNRPSKSRLKLRADHPELKEGIRRNYDSIARWYDLAEGVLEWLGIRRQRRALLSRARGRVLEVAVGTGVNLSLYPPGLHIDAVDLSAGMLERGRRKAARMGLEATFHRMDAEALDFPDAYFDTVVSTLSTCTFPNPLAALKEMGRVLRPEGELLLLEHGLSDRSWLARFQARRAERHFSAMGCRWDRHPPAWVQEAGWYLVTHHRFLLGMGHLMVLRVPGSRAMAPA